MSALAGPYFMTIKDRGEACALARAISDKPRNGQAFALFSGYEDAYIIEWSPKGERRGNMTVREDGSVWDHATNKLVKRCVLPTLDAPYYRDGEV